MASPSNSSSPAGCEEAVRLFVRELNDKAQIVRAARLEAVFAGLEPAAFGLTQALAAAWPAELGAPPSNEVICALNERGPDKLGPNRRLTLAAFDASGRLLLRRGHG
jgi:hypothetical protein